MARIPLAEIPGVANQSGPILSSYPNARVNMGEIAPIGAGPSSVNGALGRIAASGMQNQIGQNAFNGPGQGMQAIGQAVGSTASVFNQLNEHLQTAQNAGDMAKAEALMQDAYGAHSQESLTLPPEKRVALWETKYRPMVEKQIADLNLSPLAASRVLPQWTTFDAKTRTNIAYDSYKAKIADNELAIKNGIARKIENLDFEGAKADARNLFPALGYSPSHIEVFEIGIDKQAAERNQLDRQNFIVGQIAKDPFAADEMLKKVQDGDYSTPIGRIDAGPLHHLQVLAKQAKAGVSADLSDDVDQKVLTGVIANEKQLRDYVGNKLPERQILSHVADMAKMDNYKSDAQRQAAVTYNRPGLLQAIDAYDPSQDKTMDKYFALKDQVKAQMPEGERQDFLEMLSTKRKSGDPGESQLIKAALETTKTLAGAKLYGQFDEKKVNAGDWEEIQKMQKAGEKRALIDQSLRDWAKANPDKVKDPQAVGQFMKNLIDPVIQENGKTLQQLGEGGRLQDWSQTSMLGRVSGRAQYSESIPSTNFSLPKSVGGVDEKYDSNTAKGNAAAGERLLTPGVVAVNTDKYPLGTVFRDTRTGEAFIALDRHGNDDPNVVDFYKEPKDYVQNKVNRSLQVITKIEDLPRSVQGVRDLLSKYGKVPSGESAVETLARINAAKEQAQNVRTWKQPTSKLGNAIPVRN